MTELQARFGESLRRFRTQRGLTQSQLAEAVGRSTDLVSRIERGDSAPSFDTLEALCLALKVPAAVLFGGDVTTPSDPILAEIDRLLGELTPPERRWLLDLIKLVATKPR